MGKSREHKNMLKHKLLRGFSSDLLKTVLNNYHKETLKAKKMAGFCGYEMPIFYEGWGLIKEHNAFRNYAAVFDVSHMGQIKIYGSDREEFVNRLFCADTTKLSSGVSTLTLL